MRSSAAAEKSDEGMALKIRTRAEDIPVPPVPVCLSLFVFILLVSDKICAQKQKGDEWYSPDLLLSYDYSRIPTRSSMNAYSSEVSLCLRNRPDTPPWPPSMLM